MNGLGGTFYLLIGFLMVWKLIRITATPTSYDQRQTGDVNVHIDVSDVQVVALLNKEFLDEYTDYNYAYDYADFTIKPVVKPTSTGSSVLTDQHSSTTWPTEPSPSSTSTANEDTEISTSTSNLISLVTVSTSTVETENISSTNTENTSLYSTTPKVVETTKSEEDSETLINHNPEAIPKISEKRCPSGTLGNGNGRCIKVNRRRMSILPRLALKLAPKLSQEGASKDLRIISWMSPSS